MKRFMQMTGLFEEALKKTMSLWEKGNQIDLANGGEDYIVEDVFWVYEDYVANEIPDTGTVIQPDSMYEFLKKVLDAFWTMSVLETSKLKKQITESDSKSFVAMKIEETNYCKESLVIKIVNELTKAEFGFNLIEKINEKKDNPGAAAKGETTI